MKTHFTASLVVIGISMVQGLYAQHQVVPAGGNSPDTGGGSVTYSIGQVFDQTGGTSSAISIEGLQQPFEISGALPVTLIYFRASVSSENTVALTWSTASEVNNDYCSIERSPDAKKFSVVARVEGAGDKHQTSTYSADDARPLSGVSYYRLKQTDMDGTFAYSRIVKVETADIKGLISTYPNPTTDQLIIRLAASPVTACGYELFEKDGRLVKEGLIKDAVTALDISRLSAGIYLLKVNKDGHSQQTFRVMKL